MILTEYTQVGNGEMAVSLKDTILLSLLPYGVARIDSVSLYYTATKNAVRAITQLEKEGLISLKEITVKMKRYSYNQKYISITPLGLLYIAERYPADYPWLKIIAQRWKLDTGTPGTPFYLGISNSTLSLLLNTQACNVAFNIAGATTIFDRVRYEPQKARAMLETQAKDISYCKGLFFDLQKAYSLWSSSLSQKDIKELANQGKEMNVGTPGTPQFYDSIELKIPDGTAYQFSHKRKDSQSDSLKEDAPKSTDRKERMMGHSGILQTTRHIYIVYRATRDGITWNSTLLAAKRAVFGNEASRLGVIDNAIKAPSSYPSILLLDGKGKQMNSFRCIYKDTYRKRKGKDKQLGRGTYSLHAIPTTREALAFMEDFIGEQWFANFNVEWVQTLTGNMPDDFQRAELGRNYMLTYKGIPCYFGMDMDIQQLNHCQYYEKVAEELEEAQKESGEPITPPEDLKYAVVCYQWQAKYIREIAPHATIVYIDFDKQKAVEYNQ